MGSVGAGHARSPTSILTPLLRARAVLARNTPSKNVEFARKSLRNFLFFAFCLLRFCRLSKESILFVRLFHLWLERRGDRLRFGELLAAYQFLHPVPILPGVCIATGGGDIEP